jgi:hypothetical protein
MAISVTTATTSRSYLLLDGNRLATAVLNGTALASNARQNTGMLTTIVVILLVLWVLGMVTSYTLGGLLHILLVVAVIVVLLRVIQGRNPLRG